MKAEQSIITILPQKRLVKTTPGFSLLESLNHHGIFLRSDCGGKGRCQKCQVDKITKSGERRTIESCMHQIHEDVSIEIPESSLASSHTMSKADVRLPPTFDRQFENKPGKNDTLAAAIDLGTTTIGIYLCHTGTAKVISSIAVKNPQAIYGDDVMSRITAANQNPEKLTRLQQLVVKSIEWGIGQLLSQLPDETTFPAHTISRVVVVGNPTMIHILAGISPESIGMSPYLPVFHEERKLNSRELGFSMDDFFLQILPQISGFIGGDILAAAMGVDLENQPDATLLIDLGTNGELMLKKGDQIFAASCATGPAFEGASLSCGMQASAGAINSVEIDHHQQVTNVSMVMPPKKRKKSTIKPSGVCGAGVINAVAQFCDQKIILPDGAFTSERNAYTLVPADDAANGVPVEISQKDIRSVQLGKSALITGIEFLLKNAGLEKPEKIIIAGAFGSYLNKQDLVRLGMIPDIDLSAIDAAGNAAGAGAVMTVCDESYVQKAVEMADTIQIIELAGNIEFQDVFINNLQFPDS